MQWTQPCCVNQVYIIWLCCVVVETESYKNPVNYKLVDINTCHPVSFPSLDYIYPMFVCACIFYEKYGGLTIVIPSVITASSTWFILTCLPRAYDSDTICDYCIKYVVHTDMFTAGLR